MNFTYKKVSVQQTIETLARQRIHVDDEEAVVILDFLYLMSKNYKEIEEDENHLNLNRNSNLCRKTLAKN